MRIKINHDDQPETIIDKINDELKDHHLNLVIIKEGEGWVEYEILPVTGYADF